MNFALGGIRLHTIYTIGLHGRPCFKNKQNSLTRKFELSSIELWWMKNGMLSGFVQFFPIVGVTRLGLGLRPDLCGKGGGIGTQFVQLLVQEAQRRTPRQEIDLEVLVWNERAIQTYERAGFTITDTYEKWTPTGMADFHCMVYTRTELNQVIHCQ